MKNKMVLLLLVLAFVLPFSAQAQLSATADYFGTVGNAAFRVAVSDDGTGVTFYYFSAGVEEGSGPVGANNTASFVTNRNRPVTIRLQGGTVSGTFLNQAFSATRESDLGPLAGISGIYSGSLFEARTNGASATAAALMRLYPSGRTLFATFFSNGVTYYSVGAMSGAGAVTFALSSNNGSANGDSWRMTFSPEADFATGGMTSSFFPLNQYAYFLVRAKSATVINVATRGTVAPTQSMTAGFVVTGGRKTLLIRAVGPTLGAFGVGSANADTRLTLFSGQASIATNDNWGDNANASDIPTAAAQVGAFALVAGSRDAALLVQVQPGAYTAQATSVGSASGDVLIEVYEVTK